MTQQNMHYADYAASNPIDDTVKRAMQESWEYIGNPSAVHACGRNLRIAIDDARTTLAKSIGAKPVEITYTSGATEANTIAVHSAWKTAKRKYTGKAPMRILISALEHASIRSAVEDIAKEDGASIDIIPVGKNGMVHPKDVQERITKETVLVAVLWTSNIFGTIQPIEDIGRIVQDERASRSHADLPIVLLCDAVQAIRTEPVSVAWVDMLTVSAHKCYGPKGIGALYKKEGIPGVPIMRGGGQEFGMRGGTESVTGILGMHEAIKGLGKQREHDRIMLETLTETLIRNISHIPKLKVACETAMRSPGILFIESLTMDGDMLAMHMDARGIAVSSGSACDSGKRMQSSAIHTVLGNNTKGGIRISLGRWSTEQDITVIHTALTSILQT